MRFFYDALNFFIDRSGGLIAVTGSRFVISADEHLFVVAVVHGAHSVAHTPFGNHFSRALGRDFDVARSTRRNVFDDKFFRNSSAVSHNDVVKEFRFA